tara:strand:+ start:1300 stop:2055 length:756 start_codon:yes stop_codon:yes gene_type:complete
MKPVMNKNIAIGDIKNHPTNHYELHMITLPAGTRLGYKVITAESDNNNDNYDTAFKNIYSSVEDWSGTYINNSIITAMGYCGKKLEHYSKIQLIEICTKKELTLMDCPDYLNAIKADNNDPADKENQPNGLPKPIDLLKSTLSKINITGYIVNDIGEKLGSATVSWDANTYEIAFPHSLNQFDFLTMTPIATIKTKNFEARKLSFHDHDPITIPSGVQSAGEYIESIGSMPATFPTVNFDELRELPKTKIV